MVINLPRVNPVLECCIGRYHVPSPSIGGLWVTPGILNSQQLVHADMVYAYARGMNGHCAFFTDFFPFHDCMIHHQHDK